MLIRRNDSPLQREMIQNALEGKSYDSLGDVVAKSVFAQGDEKQIKVSTSPTGSPVATSPRMVVLDAEAEFVEALRKEEVVQLAMF